MELAENFPVNFLKGFITTYISILSNLFGKVQIMEKML